MESKNGYPDVLIDGLQTKGFFFFVLSVNIDHIYVITLCIHNYFRLENIALPTMCLADFTGDLILV